MKNVILLILSFLIANFTFLTAQTSVELMPSSTIQIIGTVKCVDYDNGNRETTTVNTAVNLFDNNVKTYFATYQRSYGWGGLDLGTKHVITKVAYASSDRADRVLLGVFEGANESDFSDAIPMLIVKQLPELEVLTEEEVSCSRGFRYVRFVGPNDSRCKISELKFFGYEGDGDDSNLYRVTNLPTVTIQTKDAAEITSRTVYVDGMISVISEDNIYTDELEIRGRGNASWGFPKKPYRIKLANKANLLGMPAKEKSWTLINNYGDKTLMRNLLAFDLSERFEMAYTPAGTPVDVILNGEYKGCYQLCDHLGIKPKRVEVDELKLKDASDPEKITGGYLIEVDAYASGESPINWFESNGYRIPVTIGKSFPDDGTYQELLPFKNYIKGHFEKLQAAVFSTNYKDPENGFRKYLDVSSFVRHFLVGEISGNTDTYWSTYMYKNRGEDKFYVGPVWDFDIAYDNDNRTYPINSRTNWIYLRGSSARNMNTMVNQILSDPDMIAEIEAVYAHYRNKKIITEEKLMEVIDNYATALDESQKLNFTRWKIMNQSVHQNPRIWGSYDAEVENVRKYTKARIAWMDNKLNYVPAEEEVNISNVQEDVQPNLLIRTEANRLSILGVSDLLQINIFDINGKLISQEKTKNNYAKTLNKGAYILTITNMKTSVAKTYKCLIP